MTSASSMHEGHSNQHSGAPQRDRAGREVGQDGGTHVHPGLIHVNVWQKSPHTAK